MAVKTAQYYSLRHERVTYTPADTAKYVERAIYHTEVPVGSCHISIRADLLPRHVQLFNPHSVAKFRLSEFAREKNFVVSLTGEGADELFLGYSPFRNDVLLAMRSRGGSEAVKAEKLREAVLLKEGPSILTGSMPEDTPK